WLRDITKDNILLAPVSFCLVGYTATERCYNLSRSWRDGGEARGGGRGRSSSPVWRLSPEALQGVPRGPKRRSVEATPIDITWERPSFTNPTRVKDTMVQ
ncbi:hypothetical protein DNTS_020336, partial [Danionella cerebrum]